MPSEAKHGENLAREARQAKETLMYRIFAGALCASLITFGLLGLLDVINVHS
jgi:hypothetical protein